MEAFSRHPLNGWPIDLRGLYGWFRWKNRAKFSLREHLFESSGGDTCILLFYIGEFGVSKVSGHLAVFRNKNNPVKIFDGGRKQFWYFGDGSVQWNPEKKLAFMYECKESFTFWKPDSRRYEIRLRVLDLSRDCWSSWEHSLHDLYTLRPVSGTQYATIQPDPPLQDLPALDITRLKWESW